MKIKGIQYYWIVASGLVLHTILALMTILYSDQLDEADSATLVIYLIVWVPALICYYTVILEMWSVFRLRLILSCFFLFLVTFSVHPYFLLLIVFAPNLYWLWRITGNQGKYT
ncbi:hypothetical protein BBM68_06730 [Vibrio parahaemolyticus]|uniref:hypothetical protein n=1 Tax=Vibrio parahaemolyticus TaxID=670 RepID=UPI00084B6C0B|nr:hypothetical protein [Vibrio parahaemolyticus]OEA77219.1 hypothetical protein BBM68_06730 [Vibrio parahaemolyticus]OEA81320.1 hypothetical protein BBM67_03790 [Vibrio parahaemolyticus]